MFPRDIRAVLSVLSRLPYENLSKAIAGSLHDRAEAAMADPLIILEEHRKNGTGGTCFSLTWFVCRYLKDKGHDVYPVLCDRVYGENTHCCAVMRLNGRKYVLDPGYLSFTPILLSDKTEVETPFNSIVLEKSAPDRYRLNTVYRRDEKYRFTLKDAPVPDECFLSAWKDSFAQESMNYPVVTMLRGNAHLYFQKESLYVRRRGGSEKISVPRGKLPEVLKDRFGISDLVTRKAAEIFP